MNLLIDADACPVTGIAVKAARARKIPAVLFCDSAHEFLGIDAEVVTVMRGADSADFKLTNRVRPGDVVVTQDYGLAAMCLAKGAIVLRQDGLRFTDDNILPLLNQRHEAKKRLRAGGKVRGPKKRDKSQNEAFLAALEAIFEERPL